MKIYKNFIKNKSDSQYVKNLEFFVQRDATYATYE